MTAYGFQARFAEPILAGTKGGTIRAPRKSGHGNSYRCTQAGGHALPGEEMQLYTGMRTRECRLIARRRCLEVERVALNFGNSLVGLVSRPIYRLDDLDAFARFDGFLCWLEMCAFWDTATAFEGWHIRWLPLPDFGDG